MFSFACDYLEGCHEEVLRALEASNRIQAPGYGEDPFTKKAVREIREACEAPHAAVHFISGGTQTNQLVIDTVLESYEGALCASSGHINVHEAGAIEYSGHKAIALPSHEGKVEAKDVREYLERFYADETFPHMVFPGMVYISHPTEYGTLYTADELKSLSDVCRQYQMKLYLDGARLGYGLMARGTDVTLPLIAKLCDVFYIGGTKVGMLNGEALVFPAGKEPSRYVTRIKQHGALAAKGRLMGVQFAAMFEDGLYFRISRHADEMAYRIRDIFLQAGCRMWMDSPTNQQFVILEDRQIEELSKCVGFEVWQRLDEHHQAARFAASWATTEEMIDALQKAVDRCIPRAE